MGEKCILLADADARVIEAFRQALDQQWRVTAVASGSAALTAMLQQPFDILIADLDLPGIGGAELLNQIRNEYPRTIRFILAADGDYRLANLEPYAAGLATRFGSAGMEIPSSPLSSRLLRFLGSRLLSSSWFARHVVLDRWFLHTRQETPSSL